MIPNSHTNIQNLSRIFTCINLTIYERNIYYLIKERKCHVFQFINAIILKPLLLGFLPIKMLTVKEKKLATGYEFRMQIEFVTNCLTIQLALSILKSLHYLNIHLTSSTMEKKNFINKK